MSYYLVLYLFLFFIYKGFTYPFFYIINMITIHKNQLNELCLTNDIFRRDLNLLYRFKFYYPTRKITKEGNFKTIEYFYKWTKFTINETLTENLLLGDIDLLQSNSQWSFTVEFFDVGLSQWLEAYTDLVTIT